MATEGWELEDENDEIEIDSPIDYLVVGHVTQDRAGTRYAMGGTATYASLTARTLGQRVGLLTSAAFEPGLIEVLYGVQVARVPAEETTRFVNTYEGGLRRQHVEARAELLTPEQLLPEWLNTPVVHLAPIADELRADFVDAFPDALIGVTPQGWMRAWDESGLVRAIPWAEAERVLARADAVILSEQDVDSPQVIERYIEQARLLVVTRGDRGASVYANGTVYHSAAFQAGRQSDPTGAGDVFAAAFFVQLASSGSFELAADFANCVASFAIEKRHSNGIPSLDQVNERWQNGKRRRHVGPA